MFLNTENQCENMVKKKERKQQQNKPPLKKTHHHQKAPKPTGSYSLQYHLVCWKPPASYTAD